MLTSKQRAQLRGMANSIETIFQVGKAGVNEVFVNQVNEALEKRELIKLRTLDSSPVSTREAADEISEKSGADVVQVIGSRFVIYKESRENKQITLI